MSAEQIFVYLVIALCCGLLGQALAGRSLGGFVVSTILGLIGAMLGTAIAQAIKAPEPLVITVGGRSIQVLWSIIGATLVTVVLCLFRRPDGNGRVASY